MAARDTKYVIETQGEKNPEKKSSREKSERYVKKSKKQNFT